MKAIITNSMTTYNSLIARHNTLLKTIETKNIALHDMHTVLKILKTVAIINNYQKENLPSSKSLEGYINEQNKAIKLADSLTKE
jgi:hypothetical protein